MNKNFNHRAVTGSQKIYERLLRAYPPAHREKYGPAMAQLFRDQCRDAWAESQGWGIIQLWLRVLPDLLKTSIIERLAALNERKSMSDKIASLIQPRAIFFKVFAVVFLITVMTSVAITFILPETYASTAKIFLRNTNGEKNLTPDASNDPYVIQTEMETIASDPVLGAVIKKLALDQEWSKRYANGRLLDAAETMKLLRQRVIIHAMGKDSVLEIEAFDEKPAKARSITSAILESYISYKVEHDQQKLINIPVIQTPSPPYLARPNKPKNIFYGVLVGIGLGLMAVVTIKIGRAISHRLSHRNVHA